MDQPVILCGLGQVGWRVLSYLRAAGVPVTVVDHRCQPGDPRLEGARLVQGDCRQPAVLDEAGIFWARAVLILANNDLVNISTVLTVRHLDPKVRVVVRLFNQNIISRLGKAVPNVFALSVPHLTASLIALTALTGRPLGTFTGPDGLREIAELTISGQSPFLGRTVAELVGPCPAVALAHLPDQGPERFLLDVDPNARLAAGDQLVVCGKPDDLEGLLAQLENDSLPPLRWAGWTRRLARMTWRTLTEVDRPVKAIGGVLLAVIVTGTLVYYRGVNKSLTDALYRTISVIATGADMREQELTLGWQKVFVSVLRLTGLTLVAAFTALVTNFLLRARLGGVLEIRRIPDSGHVVVCGLGSIGFQVVRELLALGERVVVVEQSRDGRFLAPARRLGVPVLVGDATVLEVLRQAHARTARAVVAVTSNELVNLEVALLARELDPRQRVVVRVTDSHLAQTLREAANVRFALSIPTLAAPAFVAAVFGDRVQSVFLVGGRMWAVVELVVGAADPFLAGQSVRALALDYRLLPVGLAGEDGGGRPDIMEQQLGAGDRLTVMAALSDLERVLRRERVPAGWAVEVIALAPPGREPVARLLCRCQGLGAEEADRTLSKLPACVGTNLTRGQAEDLLARVRPHGEARLRGPEGSVQ